MTHENEHKTPDLNTDHVEEARILPISEQTHTNAQEQNSEESKNLATVPDSETISVPRQKLADLIDTNKNLQARIEMYEANEDKMADVFERAMKAFSLVDENGQPAPELKTGDGLLGKIFDSLKEKVSVVEWMTNRKRTEDKLAKEFSFFSELLPIFEEHANRRQQRKRPAIGTGQSH